MAAPDDPDDLFRRALKDGTDEAIGTWVASGSQVIERLRLELSNERIVDVPGIHSERDILDNLGHACYEAARAYPDAFLAVFSASTWDADTFVIDGLSAVHRPEVTRRIVRLLEHPVEGVRIHAAVALRGHTLPGLRTALESALNDQSYLVRFHVQDRLAELLDPQG